MAPPLIEPPYAPMASPSLTSANRRTNQSRGRSSTIHEQLEDPRRTPVLTSGCRFTEETQTGKPRAEAGDRGSIGRCGSRQHEGRRGRFCRGEWASECCGHTGRATTRSASSERWASHRERQLRRRGGWRQHPRGQGDAELGEAGFGQLAGGMEAPDGAPSATGAAQHVGAEGALVKLGPVEAGPLWFRRG